MVVAAGQFFLVEADEDAGVDGVLGEGFFFLLAAVAPVDLVGLAELAHLLDPGESAGVGRDAGFMTGGGKRCDGVGGHGKEGEHKLSQQERRSEEVCATFWGGEKFRWKRGGRKRTGEG